MPWRAAIQHRWTAAGRSCPNAPGRDAARGRPSRRRRRSTRETPPIATAAASANASAAGTLARRSRPRSRVWRRNVVTATGRCTAMRYRPVRRPSRAMLEARRAERARDRLSAPPAAYPDAPTNTPISVRCRPQESIEHPRARRRPKSRSRGTTGHAWNVVDALRARAVRPTGPPAVGVGAVRSMDGAEATGSPLACRRDRRDADGKRGDRWRKVDTIGAARRVTLVATVMSIVIAPFGPLQRPEPSRSFRPPIRRCEPINPPRPVARRHRSRDNSPRAVLVHALHGLGGGSRHPREREAPALRDRRRGRRWGVLPCGRHDVEREHHELELQTAGRYHTAGDAGRDLERDLVGG